MVVVTRARDVLVVMGTVVVVLRTTRGAGEHPAMRRPVPRARQMRSRRGTTPLERGRSVFG